MESKKIYPHDIVLLLDVNAKKIYFYAGIKARSDVIKTAKTYIDDLRKKFPKFTFEELGTVVPLKVQKEIDDLLDTSYESQQKIDRTPLYNAFLIISYVSLVAMFFSYLIILGKFGWTMSSMKPGIVSVSQYDYADWVLNSKRVILVMIILFSALFIVATLIKKIFLISTAFIGVIVEVGNYFYMNLNIFLFDFQSGAEPYYYDILLKDIMRFNFIQGLGISAIVLPLAISIYAILKNTKKISYAEWKKMKEEEKRKKSLGGKKFTVLEKHRRLILLDDRGNETAVFSDENVEPIEKKKEDAGNKGQNEGIKLKPIK
ncbi:MAG: hypothetical protein ACTSU2_16565 [Promethearchaeota archaeon]